MGHRKMMTVSFDGHHYAVPSVVGNRSLAKGTLSIDQAVAEGAKRGTLSPAFKTLEEAEDYAGKVHTLPLPNLAHVGAHKK
tara:strand:+ start:226 stop:468 length:243 start_codon:yes stop_codon:yes gene_type:complete